MGIGAAVAGVVTAVSEAVASAAAFVGEGLAAAGIAGTATTGLAGALGTGIVGAGIGSGLGAVEAAVTGGNVGKGALFGGITGGITGGVGPSLGSALGIGTIGGDVLAGAGAGVLGAEATGQKPLTGLLEGAAGGAVSGALGELSAPGTASGGVSAAGGAPSPISGGPGASAASIAGPAGVADPGFTFTPDTVSPIIQEALPPLGGTAPAATSPATIAGADVSPTFASIDPSGATAGATAGLNAPLPGADLTAGASPALTTATAGIDPAAATGVGPGAAGDNLFLGGTSSQALSTTGASTANTDGNIANPGTFTGPTITQPDGSVVANPNAPQAGPTPSGATLDSVTTGGAGRPSVLGQFASGDIGGGLSHLGDFAAANPGLLLGGLGLGAMGLMSLKGTSSVPGEAQLNQIATQAQQQSQQLESFITNGTLPPGVQTSLDNAARAATATIRSQYASRGMSGSSAEAQDVANAHNAIVAQGSQIAIQLLNSGISQANLSANTFTKIFEANLQQDTILQNALASLATNAARPTISVKAA